LLSDRLSIIRYVYGVSDEIFISSIELRTLWDLCDSPRHREQLMIFVAGASRTEYTNRASLVDQSGPQQQSSVQAEDILSAVFTEETCMFAFLDLFCSDSISFQPLEEGAYKSFQLMFNRVRQSTTHGHAARSAAIDTLWRVCLGTANNGVATTAMKDLLSVYVAFGGENGLVSGQALDSMEMEPVDNSFAGRVFECLEKAKYGLANGDSNAILAVERCLRILNAAIGQWGMTNSVTASTLSRLSVQPDSAPLSVILNCLPHGLRGQACYRKINIMVKRAQNNQGVQVQQPGDRDVKSPTTIRFTLDVHPLETLRSIKRKTATYCECSVQAVKPISVSGRLVGGGSRNVSGEANAANLNSIPEDSVVDEIGVVQGCEIVFLIAERNQQQPPSQVSANAAREPRTRDLSDLFCDDRFAGKLFENLLAVLEWLPRSDNDNLVDNYTSGTDTHKLVWDLLLAMPTNTKVASEVQTSAQGDGDAMDVDSKPWLTLLDLKKFHRSVYVLLAIDAFLEPAVEVLSSLPKEQMSRLETETIDAAFAFRQGFIKSSGFDAVVDFFASTDAHPGMNQSMARMGNAVALRILKCCLFGTGNLVRLHQGVPATSLDEAGSHLMRSLSDAKGLLKSLTSMVVNDSGISTSTISDILKFLRMLFQSPKTAANFVCIPGGMPEMFLVTLLLWEEAIDGSRPNSSPNASFKIRKTTNELILTTPALADHALPWLTAAVASIEVSSDSTCEFFDVLQRLVADDSSTARSKSASVNELTKLATEVCAKLASCPRPANEAALVDPSTGVLCGCLAMLRAIIDTTKGASLGDGTTLLLGQLELSRWSDSVSPPSKGMFATVSHPGSKINADDVALIDLMGVVFDGFLSPGGSSAEAICCDKVSRQRAFDVISATARTCHGPEGYFALVSRINTLMTAAAPFLKHRWGQGASGGIENQPRMGRNISKYSGLRNQGCTCYMNSFLQQVFMMPELRKNMCLAPLPSSLRSSGGVVSAKGEDLVGKKVSMQWDNGISYDAMVESFDKNSGMHTIRYCTVSVATVAGANHQQVLPQDLARLPSSLPDEFLLSEGRPGKETGVFEVLEDGPANDYAGDAKDRESTHPVEESEDEAASRHLMEEVQRTFIHLDEGSRGRCFDPRALVEASACLKLEFDVWQQNDASEFATKLLDRLEISLKRWAPDHFRYLDHTFGLKQTKQKICKECGLKVSKRRTDMVPAYFQSHTD
jgi:ubiquitin carboxyl-terminal hydrolase 9/24